jgi:hypothetical protein
MKGRSPIPRVVTRFTEAGSGRHKILYHNSVNNVVSSLVGRVFLVTDKATGLLVRPREPKNIDAMDRPLGRFLQKVNYGGKLSTSDFISTVTGPKKRAYQHEEDTLGIRPTNARDFRVGCFIKDELMDNDCAGGIWEGKCPRCIRPMSVRANLLLGCHIRPLEKAIYRAINRTFRLMGGSRRTVTKGMNTEEIGTMVAEKWAKLADPCYVDYDCERFSQHVSLDMHKKLTEMLVKAAGGRKCAEAKELHYWLKQQWVTKVVTSVADGVVRCKVEGTLSDGVMNTSLYGVLCMCAILLESYLRMRATQQKKKSVPEIISAGDDTSAFCERLEVKELSEHVTAVGNEFGMSVKVGSVVNVLEHVTFCRMRPVFDGTRWRMVRNLEDAIARDVLTVKPVDNEGMYDALRAAKANCGLALCYGIPVMQAFYLMLGRGAKPGKYKVELEYSGMQQLARGLEAKVELVTDEARASFARAFGITPDRQRAIECSYDSMEPSYTRRCEQSFYEFFPETRLDWSI